MSNERHVIEISDDADNDRSYWSCDCGVGGSCASYKVDIAAEAHVPKDAYAAYRYVKDPL